MKNGGRIGMKNGGRIRMKNGGRIGMKNGGRKCIQNGVLKRRVGLALSDTLSTPTGGQKNREKNKPKNGENFGTKTGKISYQHGIITVGGSRHCRRRGSRGQCVLQVQAADDDSSTCR